MDIILAIAEPRYAQKKAEEVKTDAIRQVSSSDLMTR